MSKEVVSALVLFGILLVLPVLSAENETQNVTQEQLQTYSGFERFVDNVKMFFSSGDGKVMLALEIREKEINSALAKFESGDREEALKELERARERLQLVQEKVSANAAEAVGKNIDRLTLKINERGNLSEDFETYKLEEKKTKLVADLVIEVNGTEGQTLKREVVRNESSGENKVVVVVEGDNGTEGRTKTREIVGQIGEVNNQIAQRVVKTEMASGTGGGSGGLTPEVKTYVKGDGTDNEEPLPTNDLNKINPALYDPNARAPGDTVVDPDGPDGYAPGTTAGGSGVTMTARNDIAPAIESNEGDN